MLDRINDDVWAERRSLRFFGVECGTKMTVVRLSGGGLFVHSPVALDAATREAVDALGTVTAIVAPSLFHHLYVAEWAAAYPKASLSACPGLEKKRADITWSRVLGDRPDQGGSEWSGEIEQVFFGARTMENEVIFFHKASKTIVSCDFMFNLSTHPSPLTRTVAFLLGQRKPGSTLLERVMIRDRVSAREQMGRVIAWEAERLLLAHGENVGTGASEAVRSAYAWL